MLTSAPRCSSTLKSPGVLEPSAPSSTASTARVAETGSASFSSSDPSLLRGEGSEEERCRLSEKRHAHKDPPGVMDHIPEWLFMSSEARTRTRVIQDQEQTELGPGSNSTRSKQNQDQGQTGPGANRTRTRVKQDQEQTEPGPGSNRTRSKQDQDQEQTGPGPGSNRTRGKHDQD
ncbi:hypothetical protein VZT92_012429 [Zoarces viviparus]|uniref:Uncharacterized protein n=1 Tax=Zoarces viviparus TaxID=48416 RepID=A0AAW1F9A9_ZOAVI